MDDIRTIPQYVSLYWISYVPFDKVKYKDRIDLKSTLSQEFRFTLLQHIDSLYIQDKPTLQDNNTLLHPRYTIVVRFYVGPKYVGHLESKERLRIQPAQLFNFSWWVMWCVQ